MKSFELVLRANHAAVQVLCKSGIKVDRNDVGDINYSNSTGIRVPHLGIKVLLNASTTKFNTWLEAADIVTDLYIDIYVAPKGYRDHIERQRAFVGKQDKPTDRAARLLCHIERSEPGIIFLGLSDQ